MPNPDFYRGRFFKETFKKFVSNFLRFHRSGDQPDILILSSPRSGSTWLTELIGTQPGLRKIDEPLNKDILDYNRLLPIATRWNYLGLTSSEERVLKRYFQTDRDINRFGPVNFFSKDYHFFTNRRVFKVVRANALIEWFSKDVGMEVIYLVRHPIAQSLSSFRRGHHCQIADYLADDQFVRQHLDDSLKKYILSVIENGEELDKFVLEWCLDNLVPIKESQQSTRDWHVVTYEELVLRPRETIEFLSHDLGLANPEKMLARLKAPSKVTDTSTTRTIEHIRQGDREHLVTKWRRKVDPTQEEALFKIVDKFDIEMYAPGRFLAKEPWLNFRTSIS